MNYAKIGIKSIGVISSGILAYDISKSGVSVGARKSRSDVGSSMADIYINHGSSNTSSKVLNKTRKWYKSKALDDNFFTGINKTKNVIKGIYSKFEKNIVPIGLSIGAVTLAGKSGLKKYIAGACATLLSLRAVKSLAGDVLGIGRSSKLN